jgi:hypothetical protein
MSSFSKSSVFKSSGGSSNLTSHASHSASREVAKLAVDIRSWILREEIVTSRTGKKYVTVQGEIGEELYESLCSYPGPFLVTLNYCQIGIEGLRSDSTTWRALGRASTGVSKESGEASANRKPSELAQAPESENLEAIYEVGIFLIFIYLIIYLGNTI